MKKIKDEEIVKNDKKDDKKIISVKITDQGRNKIMDILQNHVGYIEEELHEQILNDLQTWMNENYSQLLDFYIKAVTKGLVPSTQLDDLIKENNELRKQLKLDPKKDNTIQPVKEKSVVDNKLQIVKEKSLSDLKKKKTPIKKKEENNTIKPIDEMNGWELRALAKKMGIPLNKGMNKTMIYELVRDEIKAKVS